MRYTSCMIHPYGDSPVHVQPESAVLILVKQRRDEGSACNGSPPTPHDQRLAPQAQPYVTGAACHVARVCMWRGVAALQTVMGP